MKKILFIDACINRETSRTERLAQAFLKRRIASGETELKTVVLENLDLKPLDSTRLAARDRAVKTMDFSSDMFQLARDFAAADEFVLAAPYWDLGFPAAVKLYMEQICVCGLTFRYSETGTPIGLTNIKTATYITTAGGYIGKCNFGYDYVQGLFKGLFCIGNTHFISAEGLDIWGNSPSDILQHAIAKLESI